MKKLLGLFGVMPLALSACGITAAKEVDLLPVAEGFVTEFGDLNVYDLDSYHALNNGDIVTLQLKLEQKTVAAQWGYEVRFSDINETKSVDMAEEIFGSTINRLFFSFPDSVMDQMTVGGVYLMEFEKNNFPPNGRPQFGISGIEATGGNMDMDGKLCSVDKLEDCHDLENNKYGEYSSLTNLRSGGQHKIKTDWIVDPSGSGDYYGIGDIANKEYAYSDDFGTFDITTLDNGKEYIFTISDADWVESAHGQGDFYLSIEIEDAIEVINDDSEEPEHDFGFENNLFENMSKGNTYDNVVVMFNKIGSDDCDSAEIIDANGTNLTTLGYNTWPIMCGGQDISGIIQDKWFVLEDLELGSAQVSWSSHSEITDYNPA